MYRGTPVRIIVRDLDNRMVNPIEHLVDVTPSEPFDDTRTLYFVTGAVVWPLMRLQGDPGIDEELVTSGGLVAPGRVIPGVADNEAFYDIRSSERVRPFSDTAAWDAGGYGSTTLSGSLFTGGPSDRVVVRREFTVASEQVLPGTTASLHYFDVGSSSWTLLTAALTPPGQLGQPLGLLGEFTDASFWSPGGNDAKLFGPFGNLVTSGVVPKLGTLTGIPDELSAKPSRGALNGLMTKTSTDDVLTGAVYSPGRDAAFVVDWLDDRTFVLEGARVEVPMAFGPGWFEDITRVVHIAYNIEGRVFTGSLVDAGGPAITYTLLRETYDGSRRDVVAHGVATHIVDASSLSETKLYQMADAHGVTASDPYPPGTPLNTPAGLVQWRQPNAVVPAFFNPFFGGYYPITGTIKVPLDVLTPSSIVSAASGVLSNDVNWKFEESFVGTVGSYCRGTPPMPTHRSYFGGDYGLGLEVEAGPTSPDTFVGIGGDAGPFTGSLLVPHFVVFNTRPGGYILRRGDRLLLAVTKHRPVRTQEPTSQYHSTLYLTSGNLTGSHDVRFVTGTIAVELYGTFVSNSSRSPFDVVSPTNTVVASDVVGPIAPPTDEHAQATLDEVRGTYIDDYVTGTMPTRGVVASKVDKDGASSTIPSVQRYVTMRTTNERYVDTTLPRASDVISRDGATVVNINNDDVNYVMVGRGSWASSNLEFDDVWEFEYPFSPRYSDIPRQLQPQAETKATKVLDTLGSTITSSVVFTDKFSVAFPSRTALSTMDVLTETAGGGTRRYVGFVKAAKAFYGFARNTTLDGVRSHLPRLKTKVGGPFVFDGVNYVEYYADVEIDGWKYGVKSGVEQHTSIVFRHDTYGQFRDMLEQRPYSMLRNDKGLLTPPVVVRFTLPDPLDTDSSNVSVHATSSVPYIDGVQTNRPPPPSFDLVNVDLPLVGITP